MTRKSRKPTRLPKVSNSFFDLGTGCLVFDMRMTSRSPRFGRYFLTISLW